MIAKNLLSNSNRNNLVDTSVFKNIPGFGKALTKTENYLKMQYSLFWILSIPPAFLLLLLGLCLILRRCFCKSRKSPGIVKSIFLCFISIFQAGTIAALSFKLKKFELHTNTVTAMIISLFVLFIFNSIVFYFTSKKVYGIIAFLGMILFILGIFGISDPTKHLSIIFIVYLAALILQLISKTVFICSSEMNSREYLLVRQNI